jgi:hypothetical protein
LISFFVIYKSGAPTSGMESQAMPQMRRDYHGAGTQVTVTAASAEIIHGSEIFEAAAPAGLAGAV